MNYGPEAIIVWVGSLLIARDDKKSNFEVSWILNPRRRFRPWRKFVLQISQLVVIQLRKLKTHASNESQVWAEAGNANWGLVTLD